MKTVLFWPIIWDRFAEQNECIYHQKAKKLYKGKITTVQQNDILYFTCVIKPKKVSQCKKFALRLQ